MAVIEIKPGNRKHTIERQRPVYGQRVSLNGIANCDHRRMLISEKRSKVRCRDCEEELDPLEALFILATGIWWQENARERQLEHDEKRVSKVQAAALTCLFEAGITPEKYAIRWAKLKEEEERKAAPIIPTQEPINIESKPRPA